MYSALITALTAINLQP